MKRTKVGVLVAGSLALGAAIVAVANQQPSSPASAPRVAPDEPASSRAQVVAATDVKPPLAPASLAGGWKYTAGSLTTNCDGKSQTKDATGSNFLLEESPNEVGAFVYRKGGCAVSLSLEGKTLSAPAGTSCAEGSLQVVYQKMSMTGSASAADIQSSGTMTGSFGAKTVSCTFASSGRVARL